MKICIGFRIINLGHGVVFPTSSDDERKGAGVMFFDFNCDAAKLLDKKEAQKLLLMHGMLYYVIAAVLLVAGIVVVFFKLWIGIVLAVLALCVAAFGVKDIFLRGDKRGDLLTSILVAEKIKNEKQRGKIFTKEDITKIKFEYDPLFRNKVESKVRKDADNAYERRIKNCEINLQDLEEKRNAEIRRLTEARWETVGDTSVKFNMTEGKVSINGSESPFTSIISAELNKEDSYRLVAGKPTKEQPDPDSVRVDTCNHVGVMVNIGGYQSEVVLLKITADQTDKLYTKAMNNAKEVITKLRYLATVPVPDSFLPVEDEASVIAIDDKIIEANRELDAAKADKPTYDIPSQYLMNK